MDCKTCPYAVDAYQHPHLAAAGLSSWPSLGCPRPASMLCYSTIQEVSLYFVSSTYTFKQSKMKSDFILL